MIKISDKELINKRNKLSSYKNIARKSKEEFIENKEIIIDEYIKWIIAVLHNIEEQIDSLFKQEHILDKEYRLSIETEVLLDKIKEDITIKSIKNKLLDTELEEIKRIIKRIEGVRYEVKAYNISSYNNKFKLIEEQFKTIISNKENITLEDIDNIKSMYLNISNTSSSQLTHKNENIIDDILFIEIILKQYGSIQNLLNKFYSFLYNFTRSKKLINDYEKSQLTIEGKKIIELISKNKKCIQRVFDNNELMLIKDAVIKAEKVSISIENHNDLIINQNASYFIKKILEELYSSQKDLYKFIDGHNYIDIKSRDNILKVEEVNYKLEELYKTENRLIIDKVKLAIYKYIETFKRKVENHNNLIINQKVNYFTKNMLGDLYSSQKELYKLIDSHDYIDINLKDSILKTKQIDCKLEQLRKTENSLITDKVKIDINKYIDIFKNKIDNHNIKFVLSEKNKYANFFRNIEQKALDNQQIEAILKDEYNNLVIAGAGCGKTITILGKILYILEKGLCTPDEILVISFTNATTDELKDRIDKLTKDNIQVTNFHKLGLNIIKTVKQNNISILSDRYNTIVNIVYKLSKEDKFRNMLETYIVEYYSYENIEEVFNSFGDYVKYYAQRKDILYTIKGERVKSFEEKQIANYLYINGIEYEYEKEYKYNTKNEAYKNQYKPDFYLPEYDIYIEHFGVDKYGQPPSFYSREDKYKYIKGMEWKFRIHKSKNTKLIATYSWEYKEKILLKSLEVKLKKHGVKLDRLSEAKLNDIIKTKFKDFLETLERIINIIKMQGKTIAQVREVNDSIAFIDSYKYSKNESLLDIVECVYDEYSEYLSKNNKLDFVDMVKKATYYIESGQYTKKYKYIIIDEYQDISTDRVKLIKALREINDAKLFCVGDDWQSIYRFAGSDVSFFTEFENTFGYTEKSKIENTYRFGDNVIKLSEKFIQTNPNQIKKKLKSPQNKKTDIYICSYNVENKYVLLEDILSKIPKESKVLLLDRYDEYRYQIKVKKVIDNIKNKYKKDLNIVYKTIHQSKGLEADYVVVLNNTNKIKGFPSKIENENLIDLILEKEEKYPFEEERRLFYVAMTRCKKGLFFMVDYDIKSEFIMEIEGDKSIKFDNRYYKSRYVCPKCFIGILEEKNSNSKIINICSNYPICNYIEDIPKI